MRIFEKLKRLSGGEGLKPFALSLKMWYTDGPMATTRRTRFSRRIPDHVTDEIVNVMKVEKEFLPFNGLFESVYENLKEKNAVSGGEEMLRLRAYEKLQNLVTRGLVEKEGRKYRGTDRIHEASSEYLAAQAEKMQAEQAAAQQKAAS